MNQAADQLFFSKIQLFLVIVFLLAFLVFLWIALPISNLYKLVLYGVLGLGFFGAIIYCALGFLDIIRNTWASIALLFVIFVALPSIIVCIQKNCEKEYLAAYPQDDIIAVNITCEITLTKSTGSIGSDWSYYHYFNSKAFKNGDVFTARASKPFSIRSVFVERDTIDDRGEAISRAYQYPFSQDRPNLLYVTNRVHVEETGGRKYAGSTADFRVVYTLKRVVPEHMNFWDVYFFPLDASQNFWRKLVVVVQVFGFAFCAFALVAGINHRRKTAKLQQLAAERAAAEERLQFINRLQGKSIRDASGVPSYINFINDLPVDNNDSEYGSYTVYISSNGECYHQQKGCCSARFPRHFFIAKRTHRPCQRCCRQPMSIPQWYTDYLELKKLADKFNCK